MSWNRKFESASDRESAYIHNHDFGSLGTGLRRSAKTTRGYSLQPARRMIQRYAVHAAEMVTANTLGGIISGRVYFPMSRRYCIPGHEIFSTAEYAVASAASKVSPVAVTPRTRPPAVTKEES